MAATSNSTTVLCLFHTSRQAQEALAELEQSDLPSSSIKVIDQASGSTGTAGTSLSSFGQLNLPEKDVRLLSDGISAGGTVIIVSGPETLTDKAETIFGRHQATEVDQQVIGETVAPVAASTATATAGAVIPVVEEELSVGKRQVQRGGVRVYSRVVERPVEESITLREEHATIERHPVNRAVSDADIDALQIRSVEVTEIAEVPVVQKSARVVEEVHLSKEVTENTKHISDTVRKTQVEVEQLDADLPGTRSKSVKGS